MSFVHGKLRSAPDLPGMCGADQREKCARTGVSTSRVTRPVGLSQSFGQHGTMFSVNLPDLYGQASAGCDGESSGTR